MTVSPNHPVRPIMKTRLEKPKASGLQKLVCNFRIRIDCISTTDTQPFMGYDKKVATNASIR